MKTGILMLAGAISVGALIFGCAPKTGNYHMVHSDSQSAQKALNQAILNHPLQ